MALSIDIRPKFFPLEFLIQTLSYVLLRMEHFRDLAIGMLNLFIGRFRDSLLPRIPNKDLTGKTCLITGGNSGIGLSITKSMAERGCNVHLTSRNMDKGNEAVKEIREHIMFSPWKKTDHDSTPKVEIRQLDNASFASVRKLVNEIELSGNKLDYLFINAGFPGVASNDFTEDGHELTYQTNFLSSFLMTNLLLEHNLLAPDARIIFTASTGQYGGRFSLDFQQRSTPGEFEPGFHSPPYTGSKFVNVNPSLKYANTKLMQCAFAKLLQHNFDSTATSTRGKHTLTSSMSAHVFTPSYCATPIFGKTDSPSPFRDPLFWFLVVATKIAVPVEEGAATGVYLALKDGIENGLYWDRCEKRLCNADKMSSAMLRRLWDRWCADTDVEWTLL